MDTRHINSLEEFERELEKINAQLQSYKKEEYDYVSNPLYRGQCRESYALKTTLERYINRQVGIDDYQRYLLVTKPAIEAFTEKQFLFDRNNKEAQGIHMKNIGGLEGQYEFMAYLRHHGFPSPLLDWSRSPYVALFFAYQNAQENESVAVYVYVEHLGSGKGGMVGAPEIAALGHYVNSHRRHFTQQSEYTVCVKKHKGHWYYCGHEEAFAHNTTDQDLLIKLVLPGSEKERMLMKLDSMNINAFSLLGNEEGLMSMLAFREKNVLP